MLGLVTPFLSVKNKGEDKTICENVVKMAESICENVVKMTEPSCKERKKGYIVLFSYINSKSRMVVMMKQEEIVDEIRKLSGQAMLIPSLGWHFKYNGQVYFYVVGHDESLVRFCIPCVTGICSCDEERLKEAVNVTNRDVKFIKALLSERNGLKVSLDYDHKVTDNEVATDIVLHIIKALDFAVRYLKKTVQRIVMCHDVS